MSTKILFIYLFVCLSAVAFAHADSLSVAERNALQGFNDTIDRTAEDFVTVGLVICDPGEVLYSALGHAALHLQCPAFGLDYIYSYESESVRDKIWTFLRGDLKMGMFAIPTDEFLDTYRESGRGVKEYTINLSPEQDQKLWEVMDRMLETGPNLPYDYFSRGCAQSVVHVIHQAIGHNAIHYAPWSDKYKNQTLRELGCDFVPMSSWERFFLFFLVGSDFDRVCPCEQKLIVPTDLVEVWQQATFENGKPVIDATPHVLLEASKQNEGTWCTPLLISLLMLILAIGSFATARTPNRTIMTAGNIVDYVILAIVSVAGALETYLIGFSALPCTNWNWLLIPFNILPAIGWYWRRYWALPWAIVLLIWCAVMTGEFLWGHILVDCPHIVLAASFAIVLFKQWYAAHNRHYMKHTVNQHAVTTTK